MVASGQTGLKPLIYVWNAETAEMIAEKKMPKGARRVCAIGISCADKYIAACDMSEKIIVHIFDIKGKTGPI